MKRILASILATIMVLLLVGFTPIEGQKEQNKGAAADSVQSLSLTLAKGGVSQTDAAYIIDACKLGIADYKLAGKINENISIKSLITLMENTIGLRYGKQSRFLADYRKQIPSMKTCAKDGIATRYNIAELVFYTACEKELKVKYGSFYNYIDDVGEYLDSDKYSYLLFPNSAIMIKQKDGTVNSNADFWEYCSDLKAIEAIGNPRAVNYCLSAFDRASGERVLKLFEDNSFRPKEKIRVKDAILATYHYYRYSMPEPKNVVLENAGAYNKNIITNALLNQKTKLPDATNAKLPAWKGFNVDLLSNIQWRALSDMPELWIYEADIRTIAETGANFANVRVGWGSLSGPNFISEDTVNLYYMECLDRILAWGMKYGVHIQFCFTEGPAMDKTYNMQQSADKTKSVFTDTKYRDLNVRYWRMLAKRYANIPNKYLSFCLMNECNPIDDNNYAETMKPILKAVWEQSPSRVILADIHGDNITGESMAALGVALCYHQYRPTEIFIIDKEIPVRSPDFYKKLFFPINCMTATLYSKEGAMLTWDGKGDTSKLGGKPNVIKGKLSGTLEIMLRDSSNGTAGMLVTGDGAVIYDAVPKTVSDGDPAVDVCYTASPVRIAIPEDTKRVEISCTNGIFTLSSVRMLCNDGIEVNIPALADGWQGTDMVTITIHEDGSFESDRINDSELLFNQKRGLVSLKECKAIAHRYGVGFMCGEWGFFDVTAGLIRKSPIPRKDLYAVLTAMIQAYDKSGIPWCAEYRTNYTLTNSYPINTETTYEKIDGSSLYVDLGMMEFFKNIIGAK